MTHRPVLSVSEKPFPDDAFITSKTDTKGKITYVNSIFVELSGYSERQLIGSPHSIIRHPDMPRGVFKALWDTVAAGGEFMGYVKNLSADGRFYWVLATVTPDRNASGQITGYYSVRRKPHPNAIRAIEPVYQRMLGAESRVPASRAPEQGLLVLQQIIHEHRKHDYTEFVLDL